LVCGGGRAEAKGAADHSFAATDQGGCVDLVSDFSQRTCVAFRLALQCAGGAVGQQLALKKSAATFSTALPRCPGRTLRLCILQVSLEAGVRCGCSRVENCCGR